MSRFLALPVALLLCAPLVLAQQSQQPRRPGFNTDGEPTIPTTLIENDQTRIVRVNQVADTTRSMHSHPDMDWHVFVTMNDPLVLNIQGQRDPVKLGPWQTHFFKGGVTHSITNPNRRNIQFLEFFSKKAGATASLTEDDARAIALALARGVRD